MFPPYYSQLPPTNIHKKCLYDLHRSWRKCEQVSLKANKSSNARFIAIFFFFLECVGEFKIEFISHKSEKLCLYLFIEMQQNKCVKLLLMLKKDFFPIIAKFFVTFVNIILTEFPHTPSLVLILNFIRHTCYTLFFPFCYALNYFEQFFTALREN